MISHLFNPEGLVLSSNNFYVNLTIVMEAIPKVAVMLLRDSLLDHPAHYPFFRPI